MVGDPEEAAWQRSRRIARALFASLVLAGSGLASCGTLLGTSTDDPVGTRDASPTDGTTREDTGVIVDGGAADGADAADARDGFASFDAGGNRVVFVTSATFNANLGGVAGATTKCQLAASSAGLPGLFEAWISSTASDAIDRLPPTAGPWVGTDGTAVIVTDLASLTSGADLGTAITRDEHGQLVTKASSIWTGTELGGRRATSPNDCVSWTSADGGGDFAIFGDLAQTTRNWTYRGTQRCALAFHLACFQR